jgi:hypothetical protein
MTKDIIKIVNVETGEEIEREMTDEEQALRDTQVASYFAKKSEQESAALQAEADKASAAAKLAALGLTTDDLKALGLN